MHDIVGDVRHIRLLVGAFTRERIVHIRNRGNLCVAVHFIALDPARIARAVDMLMMLTRNRRENACLRQVVHLQNAARAVCGMPLHDVELACRQAAVLVENIRMHVDLPQIVQETSERDEGQLLLREMTEHPYHCRENGDVDAVCEGIGVMRANVRQLNEVVMTVEQIKDDAIRHLLQCGNVQRAVILDGLKCIVDGTDRIDARLLLNDIGRRCKLVNWIHRGHSDRLDAELVQPANVVNGDGLTLDQIASACGIEKTLSEHHTIF